MLSDLSRLVGTWKEVDGAAPMLMLSPDGRVSLHIPGEAHNDLCGEWRVDNGETLVLVLDTPPDPDADIEVLREGTRESLCFIIVDFDADRLTLEQQDGHDEILYERVLDPDS
jgi:hypothetical protein